ncbi:MAG: hypothetical protein NZ527_04780 [Hydrogenobacter thermophilus]|nr:hypothetical protein [Hydrogenobacter thermophilus]
MRRGRPISDIKKKMWQTMRKIGDFTANDIAVICGVSRGAADSYISKLHHSGYLKVVGTTEGLNPKNRKASVYRLVKDTGILPPYEVSVIYDPNLKKVVWHESSLREKDSR